MRYVIKKCVIARVPEIEISADEYSALAEARKILANTFAVEEKYEIVLSNWLDLEKELLGQAATEMVCQSSDYSDAYAARSTLNTRLVNLLTATKLYLDQLPQHVGKCLSRDENGKTVVREYCHEEHNAHFEYRFMEALRNYVQHRGVPLSYIAHGGRWTSLDGEGDLEHYCEIGAQRRYLMEDKKFKRAVLDDIHGEVVDLKVSTRKYIESISTIHHRTRELIQDVAQEARAALEVWHEKYAAIHKDSLVGLSALVVNDQEVVEDSVPLLLDWDDVRLELQKRNRRLTNLSRRYATGKAGISEKGKRKSA